MKIHSRKLPDSCWKAILGSTMGLNGKGFRPPNGTLAYDIYFAKGEHPNFVKGNADYFDALVRDALVQETGISTDGLRSQNEVLNNRSR
jgi:hypothetical protein